MHLAAAFDHPVARQEGCTHVLKPALLGRHDRRRHPLAQAIAGHAVAAGHHVIFSNSRGPESLELLASRFGANASSGTVAEAARTDIVILAVGWDQVPAAVKDVRTGTAGS